MKTHTKCRMTYSDPIPFIEYYSMGLRKNSRHNWIINHEYSNDKHIFVLHSVNYNSVL